MSKDILRSAIDDAIARGVCPGAVALVWRDGEIREHYASGALATSTQWPWGRIEVQGATRFDLASLTKVLVTTPLALACVSRGLVSLDSQPPAPWDNVLAGATLRDLLEHASGARAHVEYFADPDIAAGLESPSLGPAEGLSAVLQAVARTPAEQPPRTRAVYSDLGFLVLGDWIARLLGAPLDRAWQAMFGGLVEAEEGPLDAVGFRDRTGCAAPERAWIAPTEVYRGPEAIEGARWVERRASGRWGAAFAHGVVHDDNAWAAGGVAGHAGLFGTARAVLSLSRPWLDASLPEVDPSLVHRARLRSTVHESSRTLGWEQPSEGLTRAGHLGTQALWHTGFTGTCVCVDPNADRISILLTNRVHPRRDGVGIVALRTEFLAAAASL